MKNHNFTISTEFIETLQYKTPFFFFIKDKITENYLTFKNYFPHSTIQYAMKANSEPEILKHLAEIGSGFEVASIYELNMLKKINVSPDRIVYGSSVKPQKAIKDFFEYGVNRFAFDSLPELEKIAAVAPGSYVYVRMSANDSGSVFKFSEKFGTEKENIVPMLLHARELGLKPYGISFHVGSQASNVMAWGNAIEQLEPILLELQKNDIKLDVIDIGGGFPCQYATSTDVPSLQDISSYIYEKYKILPYQPKLLLEPGRGMIADTGIAVAEVIARVERKGNNWLFLDLGVYNGLFETMAYQGSTRYPVSSLRPVLSSGETLFSLAGPTGDSPDIISKEVLLPSDVNVGDKLIFHNVGAYSLVCVNPFNGFPKPEVYLK